LFYSLLGYGLLIKQIRKLIGEKGGKGTGEFRTFKNGWVKMKLSNKIDRVRFGTYASYMAAIRVPSVINLNYKS
jgi:hypothetical protein